MVSTRFSRPLLATLLALVLVAVVSEPAAAQPAVSRLAAAAAPSACSRDGAYVWAHLQACGRPAPATTGYRAWRCPGGKLVDMPGSAQRVIHLRTPNTVFSCRNVTGCLSIEATGVTVVDVAVRCTSGRTGTDANGTSVVHVANGASATVGHATIDGQRGVHACIWHQGVSLRALYVDCRGVNDGVFSWADTGYSYTTGNHFMIAHNYFHDFTARTANGHIDGYQTEGAAHGLITDNTFLMTSDSGNDSDSAVAIWNGIRSSSDITVSANLIAGGGFAVYAEDYSPSEAAPAGGASVTAVRFVANVFSQRLFPCVGYYGVWYPRGKPTDGWRRTGNRVLETGGAVDAGNPTVGGRSCS